MERKFQFSIGEYYHVYSRGVEKRSIFQDESDYVRFQHLLYLANGTRPIVFKTIQGLPLEADRGETRTSVLFYALMPNHFHIVLRENTDGGISRFMSKLATSYSMYFNTKYERTGALLSHPFRARHIDSDEYFRWVVSYVHLNPLDVFIPKWKDRRFDMECDTKKYRLYPFSSYLDYYAEERPASKILTKEALPMDISSMESIDQMLSEYKAFQGLPLES